MMIGILFEYITLLAIKSNSELEKMSTLVVGDGGGRELGPNHLAKAAG